MTNNTVSEKDLFELEQEIESRIRTEYMEQYDKFQEQKGEFFEKTRQWEAGMQMVRTFLSDEKQITEFIGLDDDKFQAALLELLTMGCDFRTLLQAIQDNELVKSQWDRLMMSLRMIEK